MPTWLIWKRGEKKLQTDCGCMIPKFLQVAITSCLWCNAHWVSDIWQVMQNQEAVDLVKPIKDPQAAAKRLTTEALARKSKDDISCIVIRFGWVSFIIAHCYYQLLVLSVGIMSWLGCVWSWKYVGLRALIYVFFLLSFGLGILMVD